ncbi:mannose-1-phosphate guanylyltransferase/mannose-6-phosphate isomerase [Paralimibaculum aggregatum]|uniref:mannose-1-phosphate guanylyltransferase n=1 Tax=Paralimibaculum aggregatum TaxID=3036245 RepID=A0ABQ6LMC2_9RHOB|nr:mannose-1-phosphate guanylyltransferase/mannose-6-phosphate isomerase [Limibaculum sp. NKW23]GMG81794.1 mannose-1-phosphate guanylyltransferase/mannose-6-phosphate isomerase [Limibaculum sp. NKW23]
MATIYPVILCGGSGTRLWPVSRKSYPKQFCPLFAGGSLFQRTLERLAGQGYAEPILLTHQDFRFVVAEQLSDAGFQATRILLEPAGRNTAPAICLAALEVAAADPEGVLLVLPSDHLLADSAAFHAAVTAAAAAAEAGHLVTFGVTPDRPETGFGYIELAAAPEAGAQPFRGFVEKPDAARAAEMLASGRYLWNSGMFVFSAAAILAAFDAHAPEIRAACARARGEGREDLCFFRPEPEAYLDNPDISIDYAIMERSQGMVVPLDGGWNDLGSWRTVWSESAPDGDGVATTGPALAIGCRDTLLRAEHPDQRLVGIGLDRIVAVATGDAVLVADMDRAQEAREAVALLKAEGAPQATEFPRCYRPWGWYERLAHGPRFQVKQIMVKPGGILSLQSHHHRAEHWVVVAGTARVTVGEEVRLLSENESAYIPLGAVHRLENPGKLDLHLIEVQSGAYLGEDDITRYEDVYSRS